MQVGRTIARYMLGTVLVTALIAIGLTVRIVQFGEPVATLARADAVVVLGAAQYNGRPSPVFEERLDHAAELYRSGVAPRIVTTGGGQPSDTTTEGQAGADYLRTAGVPAESLWAVPIGADTLESLRATARVLAENDWTDIVLVTDPWHMARSRMIARDLGLHVQASPVTKGPALADDVRARYIWRELVGAVFYRLIGGSSGSGTTVL